MSDLNKKQNGRKFGKRRPGDGDGPKNKAPRTNQQSNQQPSQPRGPPTIRVRKPNRPRDDGQTFSRSIATEQQEANWIREWQRTLPAAEFKIKIPLLEDYPDGYEALRINVLNSALAECAEHIKDAILADLARRLERSNVEMEKLKESKAREMRKQQAAKIASKIKPAKLNKPDEPTPGGSKPTGKPTQAPSSLNSKDLLAILQARMGDRYQIPDLTPYLDDLNRSEDANQDDAISEPASPSTVAEGNVSSAEEADETLGDVNQPTEEL